ncbi:unnamed protein product, partial [Fusarium langsethiae]
EVVCFPDARLTDEARTQIEKVINGPEEEDLAISKHYPMGKYGTKLREIWATLATVTAYKHKAADTTSINTTSTSNQGSSPHKRPRRSVAAVNYTYTDSDEPGPSREGSNASDYMEQASAKDLPPPKIAWYCLLRGF